MSLPPLVIMGVSGSGKTTVAEALAARIDGGVGLDADDLHSEANKQKMHAGIPLTDLDRAPWLTAVGQEMAGITRAGQVPVMACSALKRAYRLRILAEEPGALFVLLDVDRAELDRRVHARQGHFMPPSLLDSQLATLEPLAPDEPGVTVRIGHADTDVVEAVLAKVIAAR